LAFDRSAFRDIFGTGKFILLSTLATFLVNSGDRAMLGKFISLDLLGIYAIALNLASMPMLLAKQFSRRIIFPLYSRKPPMENLDNRRNILKARYALTSAAFAASMALAVVGVPVVEFLYDTRYELAGAITVLLAVSMMPVVALSGHDSILLANNKAGTYTVLTVANALLRLAVLIIGINYFGILGAAVAPFIATVLHYPLLVILTRKYGAWDPKYDFLFFVLIVIAVGIVWTINAEAILAIPRETVISVF
jgi:O-antigen/teichoic acid export membrane protein